MITPLTSYPQTEFEQVLYLDNFYSKGDPLLSFDNLLENWLVSLVKQSPNAYIKRAALRILFDAYLANKHNNPFSFKALVWDCIIDTSFPLVTSLAIKIFSVIVDYPDSSFLQTLNELTDHSQADIAGSALSAFGHWSIRKAAQVGNAPEKLLELLSEAERSFTEAGRILENNTDAQLTQHFIKVISSCIANDLEKASESLAEIKELYSYKEIYEFEGRFLEMNLLIWRSATSLQELISKITGVVKWIDFDSEFKQLLRLHSNALTLADSSPLGQFAFTTCYDSIILESLDILFSRGLSNEAGRIDAVLENTEDSGVVAFLNDIKNKLPSEAQNEDFKILAALVEEYGSMKGQQYFDKIKSDPVSMVHAIANLPARMGNRLSAYKTGSRVGDEIYKELESKIDAVLPNYDENKKKIFLSILKDVIRYARRTMADSAKKDFQYLYATSEGGKGKSAVEGDLQHDLYEFLMKTEIAYGFDHEKAEFVDGGRVDIVFKTEAIVIPIELKKTEQVPTKQSIEDNYIGQAQTYVTAHDQIGLFVLLDLSVDKAISPNIRDLFQIHHLQPTAGVPINYPDYVISVIIPGNKVTPSSKSTYK